MTNLLMPNQETWYALREFETLDVMSRNYRTRHSRDLKPAKAREITASFTQAREYFTSAQLADVTVRPLLQYYGIATLSRGLVLFMRPELRETDLKEGHGLGRDSWKDVLNVKPQKLHELQIEVRSGLFMYFVGVLGNSTYLRENSNEVTVSLNCPVPQAGSKFTLGEIALRIPDLADQCAAWLGERTPYVPTISYNCTGEIPRFKFVLPKILAGPRSLSMIELSELGLDDIFPTDECPGLTVHYTENDMTVEYDRPFLPFIAQKFDSSGTGNVVLCVSLASKEYFSPITACYMLSFILGMMCRYFPTTWVNLARSTEGDAFYPFVVKALDWIQHLFPLLVTDILRSPYYFEE